MERLIPLEENKRFTLTFHRRIERPQNLFRYGNEKCPIRPLERDNPAAPPRDFLVEEGYVNPEMSSGNFCSQNTINNMKDQSTV